MHQARDQCANASTLLKLAPCIQGIRDSKICSGNQEFIQKLFFVKLGHYDPFGSKKSNF